MKKSTAIKSILLLALCIGFAIPTKGYQDINGVVQEYITLMIWAGFIISIGLLALSDKLKKLSETERMTDFIEESD